MKLKYYILFFFYFLITIESKRKKKKENKKEPPLVKYVNIKHVLKRNYESTSNITLELEKLKFRKEIINWSQKIKNLNQPKEYLKFNTTFKEDKGGNMQGEYLSIKEITIIQKKKQKKTFIEIFYGIGKVDFNPYKKMIKKVICTPYLWFFEYCQTKYIREHLKGNITLIGLQYFKNKMYETFNENEKKKEIEKKKKEEEKRKLKEIEKKKSQQEKLKNMNISKKDNKTDIKNVDVSNKKNNNINTNVKINNQQNKNQKENKNKKGSNKKNKKKGKKSKKTKSDL